MDQARLRAADATSRHARNWLRKLRYSCRPGLNGPAFLTLKNFYVFKAYNFADLYALFVGNLSDRIAGGKNFATPWGKIVQARASDIEKIQRQPDQGRILSATRSMARPG